MQAAHFHQRSQLSLLTCPPRPQEVSYAFQEVSRPIALGQDTFLPAVRAPEPLLQKLTTGTGLHAGDGQPRHTRGAGSWERRDPVMFSLNDFSNKHLHLLSLLCQQPLKGTERSCFFRSGGCTDFG